MRASLGSRAFSQDGKSIWVRLTAVRFTLLTACRLGSTWLENSWRSPNHYPIIVLFLHFCIRVVECDRAVADSHRTVVNHHVFVLEIMSEADVSIDVIHVWFEASIANVTTITAEHLVHQRKHSQTFRKGSAVVQEMCVEAHVCTYVQKDVSALMMRSSSCAVELHVCVDPGTRRDVASEDRMWWQQ